MRPIRPKYYSYRDVPTDDDLSRLIHATNAPLEGIYHSQVCADPYCSSTGPGWSTKILAEVWNGTLPHHSPEIAPRIGTADPQLPGFFNSQRAKP